MAFTPFAAAMVGKLPPSTKGLLLHLSSLSRGDVAAVAQLLGAVRESSLVPVPGLDHQHWPPALFMQVLRLVLVLCQTFRPLKDSMAAGNASLMSLKERSFMSELPSLFTVEVLGQPSLGVPTPIEAVDKLLALVLENDVLITAGVAMVSDAVAHVIERLWPLTPDAEGSIPLASLKWPWATR